MGRPAVSYAQRQIAAEQRKRDGKDEVSKK